jgi:hypothetical protein
MFISTFAGDDLEDSKNSYDDRSAPVTDTAIDTTATATTTARRPLSSTVPSLASGYSTTTIDGEKLLFRLMYRVEDLVIGIFDGDDNDDDDGHDNDDTVHDNNDDTIAVRQLEVLYQDKYVLPSDDRYRYSTTPIDRELILLCRLSYRGNRLYRVSKILSSIVLLLLQSGSVHDDTTSTIQLVVLYQDKYHTIAITQLVVLHQGKNDQYRYSVTSTDGELILLYRLAYRVNRMYQVDTVTTMLLFRLAYRVNIMYRVTTILSLIVLLLHHNDDDPVGITRPVIFQVKYKILLFRLH